jgi:hypothetical protein
MYAAKQGGRSRIAVDGEPPPDAPNGAQDAV